MYEALAEPHADRRRSPAWWLAAGDRIPVARRYSFLIRVGGGKFWREKEFPPLFILTLGGCQFRGLGLLSLVLFPAGGYQWLVHKPLGA
jgi:hypothetical protein